PLTRLEYTMARPRRDSGRPLSARRRGPPHVVPSEKFTPRPGRRPAPAGGEEAGWHAHVFVGMKRRPDMPTKTWACRPRGRPRGQVAFSGRAGAGSVSASCHFMARAWRIGAIRRITSPFWNRRTVPVDWLT